MVIQDRGGMVQRIKKAKDQKSLRIVLVLALSAGMAWGQNDLLTDGKVNGWYWVSLTSAAQDVYVRAFTEGSVETLSWAQTFESACKSAEGQVARVLELDHDLTYKQTTDEISALYRDRDNRIIPVAEIMAVANAQLSGTPQIGIDARLERMRKRHSH